MSGQQHPKREHQARIALRYRRTSMDSMKTEFRNRFLARLRTTRSKSVDRLRSIAENYDTDREFNSLTELRRVLLTEQNQKSLVGSDDVSDLLSEVEEELRQVRLEYEADTYAEQSIEETEDVVHRFLTKCEICLNLSVVPICSKCNSQLSFDMN
ncbi:uncharacterized protein LOC109541033 [Dendroctonus ponderosae]